LNGLVQVRFLEENDYDEKSDNVTVIYFILIKIFKKIFYIKYVLLKNQTNILYNFLFVKRALVFAIAAE
jgi:hypothetical protein